MSHVRWMLSPNKGVMTPLAVIPVWIRTHRSSPRWLRAELSRLDLATLSEGKRSTWY